MSFGWSINTVSLCDGNYMRIVAVKRSTNLVKRNYTFCNIKFSGLCFQRACKRAARIVLFEPLYTSSHLCSYSIYYIIYYEYIKALYTRPSHNNFGCAEMLKYGRIIYIILQYWWCMVESINRLINEILVYVMVCGKHGVEQNFAYNLNIGLNANNELL